MKINSLCQRWDQVPHCIDKDRFAAYSGLYENLSSLAAVENVETIYREVTKPRCLGLCHRIVEIGLCRT